MKPTGTAGSKKKQLTRIENARFLPHQKAKGMLAGILVDFAENDVENLMAYLEHVGFDVRAIETPDELLPAWLGHYRIGQGTYDTEKATMDLLTWPPIARRVFELQQEKAALAK